MRRFLWGVLTLCVAALFVAAVVSVVGDATAPDRSPDTAKAGDCIGFADNAAVPEDPAAAEIVGCEDPGARYQVLGDGDMHESLMNGNACAAFPEAARALVIGPEAPTFGRFLCLDTIDRG